MSRRVKRQTIQLSPQQQAAGLELLAAFALPSRRLSRPSAERAREFRRDLEADPEISSAVKQSLRELSDEELAKLLV